MRPGRIVEIDKNPRDKNWNKKIVCNDDQNEKWKNGEGD